jgi:hypothetical protein
MCNFARETAGAARTRSSLRPLLRVACALYLLGRTNLQNSGAVCRENAELCLYAWRILRDATQGRGSSG